MIAPVLKDGERRLKLREEGIMSFIKLEKEGKQVMRLEDLDLVSVSVSLCSNKNSKYISTSRMSRSDDSASSCMPSNLVKLCGDG